MKGLQLFAMLLAILLVWLFAPTVLNNAQQVVDTADNSITNATSIFVEIWEALTLASIGIIVAAAVGIWVVVTGAMGSGGSDHTSYSPSSPYEESEEDYEEADEGEYWTCAYCLQINEWSRPQCAICGSPRRKSV